MLARLVLVLTALAAGIGASAIQRDPSLQYVFAFVRHGIRSPLYPPYPNDPYKSDYSKYFQGPPGELTKAGFSEMYEVGKSLHNRYNELIGPYERLKVYVSSTDSSRTILTALTVMSSLLLPEKPLFKRLTWQPVPIWQNTTVFDQAYLFGDDEFPKLAQKVCPRYGQLLKVANDQSLSPDQRSEYHQLYQLLQSFTGNSTVTSLTGLYEIWDTLQFESLNGLSLPSWATQPQPSYNNKPLYPDIMQPVMLDYFKTVQYYQNNQELLEFYSGPLFYTIFKHLQAKAANPEIEERFRYHSTHDSTLYVFLWKLKVTQPAAVEPGDGIFFELYHQNNAHTVKIMYYHSLTQTIEELASPLCPSPCHLKQLIEVIPAISPEAWQKKCNVI